MLCFNIFESAQAQSQTLSAKFLELDFEMNLFLFATMPIRPDEKAV